MYHQKYPFLANISNNGEGGVIIFEEGKRRRNTICQKNINAIIITNFHHYDKSQQLFCRRLSAQL